MATDDDAAAMTPDWEELGRRMEKARGSLKANSIAKRVGISGKQLRNYERAIGTNGRPGAERLMQIAEVYGIDPGPWLVLAGYSVPSPRFHPPDPDSVLVQAHAAVGRASAAGALYAVSGSDEDRARAMEAMEAADLELARATNAIESKWGHTDRPPAVDLSGIPDRVLVRELSRRLAERRNIAADIDPMSPATGRPRPDIRGLKVATDRDEEPHDDGSTSVDR